MDNTCGVTSNAASCLEVDDAVYLSNNLYEVVSKDFFKENRIRPSFEQIDGKLFESVITSFGVDQSLEKAVEEAFDSLGVQFFEWVIDDEGYYYLLPCAEKEGITLVGNNKTWES
jgi:hypothetical protein